MVKGKRATLTGITIAANLSTGFHKDMASIIGMTPVRTAETLSKDYAQGMEFGRRAKIGLSSIRANTVRIRNQGMGCILGTMDGPIEETSKTTTGVATVSSITAKTNFSTRVSGRWDNRWVENMQNFNSMLNRIRNKDNPIIMSSQAPI